MTGVWEAASPPQVAGGWSEAVVEVARALVLPTSGQGMVQAGGVFDGAGRWCDMAVHWRRGVPLLVPPAVVPQAAAVLPGRWLWGGVLLNHFGHFLTESTPRLWALPDWAGRLEGIVFLHKRRGAATELHRAFLRLLGCDLPIRVIDAPTRVARLVVPGQGFGLGRMSAGTARMRAYFRDSFAPDVAAAGPERLYVSRSALGPRRGGILDEPGLEARLQAEGYEVFHPQRHPIEVQIARYRAARRIVALDGSALHLVAFCHVAGQRVAMVRRRSSSMSQAIALHLAAFSGQKPDVIDAIRADWVQRRRGVVDRFSLGELDMPALQAALAAGGYVAAGAPVWADMDPGLRAAEVARLGAGRRALVARPRGRA